MSYCKKSAREMIVESRYRGCPEPTGLAIHPPQIVTRCCSSGSPTFPNLPTRFVHHEIATSAAARAGRACGIAQPGGRSRTPKNSGGDPMQSKAQIDQILRQKCEAKEIPGVVAMAATGSEVIYQGAFGKRDLSKDDAMTGDSVFWIASMTKAVTTAAGMQLVEQGKLSLDEPIGKLLPDLASPQVLEGFDAKGEPKLRAAKNPITLRHLMTHTAGFAYDMWNGDVGKYLEKTGTPGIISCLNAALKTPVMTDPGTRWEYGTNIDFVGKAVEAVSGKKLDTYLRDNMFAPLGMSDTGFKITDSMRQRLVGMHARGPDGALAPLPFELEQAPEFHMGGGGLYGTAADYIKFTQMILNKGRGNGNQVLKPETVAQMGQNHIGDLTIGKIPTMAPMYTN